MDMLKRKTIAALVLGVISFTAFSAHGITRDEIRTAISNVDSTGKFGGGTLGSFEATSAVNERPAFSTVNLPDGRNISIQWIYDQPVQFDIDKLPLGYAALTRNQFTLYAPFFGRRLEAKAMEKDSPVGAIKRQDKTVDIVLRFSGFRINSDGFLPVSRDGLDYIYANPGQFENGVLWYTDGAGKETKWDKQVPREDVSKIGLYPIMAQAKAKQAS